MKPFGSSANGFSTKERVIGFRGFQFTSKWLQNLQVCCRGDVDQGVRWVLMARVAGRCREGCHGGADRGCWWEGVAEKRAKSKETAENS